ncbi:hypothetical protein EON63_11370 [archaeon]|nr:MAG: hypothetical protein EON63_11370 [archaeon]
MFMDIEYIHATFNLINRTHTYIQIEDYFSHTTSYLRPLHPPSPSHSLPSFSINQGGLWEEGGGYEHPQPGSRLLQYGMGWTPDKQLNPSVIYATYLKAG